MCGSQYSSLLYTAAQGHLAISLSLKKKKVSEFCFLNLASNLLIHT